MARLVEVGKSDAGSREESGCERFKSVCSKRAESTCGTPDAFRTSHGGLSMGRARSGTGSSLAASDTKFLDRKGKSDIR